jgi:hypothetical protein
VRDRLPRRAAAPDAGLSDLAGGRALVLQRVTETDLGVPRSYASLAVPLDATTKRGGCAAVYPALVPTIVAEREGLLDLARFRAIRTADPLAPVAATGYDRDGVDGDLRVPQHA